MNLWTWKRIGAQKKDMVQIFLSSDIFINLSAVLRNREQITYYPNDDDDDDDVDYDDDVALPRAQTFQVR